MSTWLILVNKTLRRVTRREGVGRSPVKTFACFSYVWESDQKLSSNNKVQKTVKKSLSFKNYGNNYTIKKKGFPVSWSF